MTYPNSPLRIIHAFSFSPLLQCAFASFLFCISAAHVSIRTKFPNPSNTHPTTHFHHSVPPLLTPCFLSLERSRYTASPKCATNIGQNTHGCIVQKKLNMLGNIIGRVPNNREGTLGVSRAREKKVRKVRVVRTMSTAWRPRGGI